MTTVVDLPRWRAVAELPRVHGAPLGDGRLREQPEDFQVEERLGFAPDDAGDHRLLWVRKTGANTEWVARQLARLAGVAATAVGYAGLKDRHAVTSQWFSVPRPPAGEPDWSVLAAEGIEVLAVHAHRRKLRRGALAGNRFRIRVRGFAPDPPALAARLAAIARDGVPNYFGEQRFGTGQSNLLRAHDFLCGAATAARVSRHKRGLWLSAARAQIFNETLAARVERGDWNRLLDGDCAQLAGSHSFFLAATVDDALMERCAALDVHPTGPLWGAGELPARADCAALEEQVGGGFQAWIDGLARRGLRQERRALRLPVAQLRTHADADGLLIEFELPAGAYATVVLRELMTPSSTTLDH